MESFLLCACLPWTLERVVGEAEATGQEDGGRLAKAAGAATGRLRARRLPPLAPGTWETAEPQQSLLSPAIPED